MSETKQADDFPKLLFASICIFMLITFIPTFFVVSFIDTELFPNFFFNMGDNCCDSEKLIELAEKAEPGEPINYTCYMCNTPFAGMILIGVVWITITFIPLFVFVKIKIYLVRSD